MQRTSTAIVLTTAALAAALAAVRCSEPGVSSGDDPTDRAAGPPNVIVLVMDTVRADHTSLLGYDRRTTPELEAFAHDAWTFEDAWSPAGWTSPAHASLFTGLRPVHHGLLDGRSLYLRSQATTLAEMLRDAGYATACFSANPFVSPDFGLTQGFGHVADIEKPQGDLIPGAATVHRDALRWTRAIRETGQPFFLFVNDMEPHQPYAPSRDTQRQFAGDVEPGVLAAARRFNNPETMRITLSGRSPAGGIADVLPDLYDAEIAGLDRLVGRLLGDLAADGTLDETLVVIASDHGESLGEDGQWGHKFCLRRRLCRVPLILRLPGVFDGGARITDAVRLEDVLPTVLTSAGLAIPEGLDGRALHAELPGRVVRGAWGPHDSLRTKFLVEFPGEDSPLFDAAIRSVYDGRHHYLVRTDGTERLFDVSVDPDETRDLSAREPEVMGRLRSLIDPW